MRAWKLIHKTYLSEILASEAPPVDVTCQTCLMADISLRCPDCLGCPSFCDRCCLHAHKHDPYHRIEVWNGRCFLPHDLHMIGLVMPLGHGGDNCPSYRHEEHQPHFHDMDPADLFVPNVGYGKDDEDEDMENEVDVDVITITHSNGIYRRRVRWCCCVDAPAKDIQLLRMRLYPATASRPSSAFTFQVLDHFYLDSMECKTSANNFYNKLRRLSCNALPNTLPVCAITT
jgi:CxC2 like cysteine cluster associated with KDZ transposases